MSATTILGEMIALTRLQVERVIKGDHQSLLEGAHQQEALLSALQEAPVDGTPEAMRTLHDELAQEKAKLQSLLEAESVRVDFMLRLLLGGGEQRGAGYPASVGKRTGGSRMLNRKT